MLKNFSALPLRTFLLGSHMAAAVPAIAVSAIWPGLAGAAVALATACAASLWACRRLDEAITTPIHRIMSKLGGTLDDESGTYSSASGQWAPSEVQGLVAAFETNPLPLSPKRRLISYSREFDADLEPPPQRPSRRPPEAAQTDRLTALPNRRGLAEHLANVHGGRTLEGTTALHCLTITNFSSIAAGLGPAAGDDFLKSVAHRISSSVRSTDLVARVGPAEIAIVQHDVRSRDNALRPAQRIRAALADPVTVDGRDVTVAASIGIALAPSGSEGRTARLIDAETAMQVARSRGPGSITMFEEAMRPTALNADERHQAWEPSPYLLPHAPMT